MTKDKSTSRGVKESILTILTGNERQKDKDPIERIIFSILISWFLTGGIFNLINKETPEYFSLEYAGRENLGIYVTIFLIIFIVTDTFLHSFRNTLLGISGLLLLGSMFLYPIDGMMIAGILMLSLSGLYLAFPGIFRGIRGLNPISMLEGAGFIALIAYSAAGTPWQGIYEEFLKWLNVDRKLFNSMIFYGAAFAVFIYLFLIMGNWLRKSSSVRGNDSGTSRTSFLRSPLFIITVLVFLIQASIIGRLLWYKYVSLNTPTYDFNLFAQMFHSMSKDFSPMTTLERNKPMSHFSVHLSPVYYLMLPFYSLTKEPGVLQILQGAVVASGVFPVMLMARDFRLDKRIRGVIALIYLLSPAFNISNFYDLHENCFLVPFLMWLFLFIERKNLIGIVVFTLLTLSIKEDAAIYLWTIGLFMALDRKMWKESLIVFLGSSGYFLWAMRYLKTHGEGAMVGRFDNMVSIKELSILSVPVTVFRNPGFFLKSIFNGQKIVYLLQTVMAAAFAPFISRRYTRFILLIPLLIMNLISDYPYQADIRFQYNYGSMAFLFYMLLLFLKDQNKLVEDTVPQKKKGMELGENRRSTAAPGFAVPLLLSLAIFTSFINSGIYLGKYEYFPSYYKEHKTEILKAKEIMDRIPSHASVTASPFLTGYLHGRDTLFDFEYNLTEDTYYKSDYMVIDLRPNYNDKDPYEYINRFIKDGYDIASYHEGVICVLARKKN